MGQKTPIKFTGQDEGQEKFEQWIAENFPESCEVPPGCPDWGPPGARECYECGEPVDEASRNCTGSYDDPLATVVGKCQICGAPDYVIYGFCHECESPVFNLGDKFYGCYHVVRGVCDFKISISRLEELNLYPHECIIKNLLGGGIQINSSIDGEKVVTHYQIVCDAEGRWDVEEYNGPLPRNTDSMD